jgi:hypothetical protein
MARPLSDKQLRQMLDEKLVVSLWPVAGTALGLKRGATYAAAQTGAIETLDISRKKQVATSWLREKLGIAKSA